MVRGNLLTVVFLFLVLFLSGQPGGISLKAVRDIQQTADGYYLADSSSSLEITQVAAPENNSGFKPVSASLVPGHEVQTWWLKFTLLNDTGLDGRWILEFPNWAKVDLYYPAGGGKWMDKKAGFLTPLKERDYPKANYNYLQVRLKRQEEKDYYVRLQSVPDKQYIPVTLAFNIAEKPFVDQKNETRKQVISIFMGLFAAMFFYNLFLYFSTRDHNYLFYLSVLIWIAFLTVQNSGYIVHLFSFWEGFPEWRDTIDSIAVVLLVISTVEFTRRFLNLREEFPAWNRIFRWIILWAAASLVAQFFSYDLGVLLSNLANLFMLVFLLVVAIKSVRRGVPSAVYFLTGWFFSIAGSTILILAALGVLPFTDLTILYAMPLGLAAETLLFSFALGNKINVLKRENEQKQERIIQQLRENEQLQTQVQRELEQKVAERTREINEQKEEIAAQKDAIEAERDKSDALLLNILPRSTAAELKQTGRATPRHYKQVSVLFNDIRDFTSIAESMSPDELVRELDECFQVFDEITLRNNLEKIKTIGDSYMCAGGIPIVNSTNAEDAVRAGLEMLEFMKGWNERKIASGQRPWDLKIGIHTGPLTAGVVGRNKFVYDIWGDTVNLASRMVSADEPGRLNISEQTYELIKDKYKCVYRGKISAKNKGEVDMYYVEGPLVPIRELSV